MKVHSLYRSISGELGMWPQGTLITILRLAGCNLECPYCDARQAQKSLNIPHISVKRVWDQLVVTAGSSEQKVLITGGEPLLQDTDLLFLLGMIKRNRGQVQVETNGTIVPHPSLPPLVDAWVVDYKLIGGGTKHLKALPMHKLLVSFPMERTYLKFVVNDEHDLKKALSLSSSVTLKVGYVLKGIGISAVTNDKGESKGLFPKQILFQMNQALSKYPQLHRTNFVLNTQVHKLLDLA